MLRKFLLFWFGFYALSPVRPIKNKGFFFVLPRSIFFWPLFSGWSCLTKSFPPLLFGEDTFAPPLILVSKAPNSSGFLFLPHPPFLLLPTFFFLFYGSVLIVRRTPLFPPSSACFSLDAILPLSFALLTVVVFPRSCNPLQLFSRR